MLDIDKIREDFPILKRKVGGRPVVYLDSAATSQKPKQVLAAMVDYYQAHNANVQRGIHTLSEEATAMMEEGRRKVADFIGAGSEKEVVFVGNATEAINLVRYAYGGKLIKKGDGVVVSLMEHHSNLVPWQILSDKTGAEFKVIEVDEEGKLVLEGGPERSEGKARVGAVNDLLDEKVKLVAVTGVSNITGVINDIEEIAARVRKQAPKAVILLDGSQMVPQMRVEAAKMGIDFLVFSGHKMLGPMGIGVLWGREEILEKMPPFLYGGEMISEVSLKQTTWNELPWKFEAGTPNVGGIVGLGAAIDYLNKLGMDKVEEHEKELISYGLEQMGKLERKRIVEIYGPSNPRIRTGVLSFNVKGVHAHDVACVLDRYGIAVRSGQHCGGPLVSRLGQTAMVRASFYVYTTKREIDYLVEKVKQVKQVFKV